MKNKTILLLGAGVLALYFLSKQNKGVGAAGSSANIPKPVLTTDKDNPEQTLIDFPEQPPSDVQTPTGIIRYGGSNALNYSIPTANLGLFRSSAQTPLNALGLTTLNAYSGITTGQATALRSSATPVVTGTQGNYRINAPTITQQLNSYLSSTPSLSNISRSVLR